jgi:hypothetical protein
MHEEVPEVRWYTAQAADDSTLKKAIGCTGNIFQWIMGVQGWSDGHWNAEGLPGVFWRRIDGNTLSSKDIENLSEALLVGQDAQIRIARIGQMWKLVLVIEGPQTELSHSDWHPSTLEPLLTNQVETYVISDKNAFGFALKNNSFEGLPTSGKVTVKEYRSGERLLDWRIVIKESGA